MLLRVLPLLIALALSLAPSSQAAVFVAAPPASSPIAATPENACTAFLEEGSESRIGLLCHNDPVNKVDPMGLLEFEFGKDNALQNDFNTARQYLSRDQGMRAGFAAVEQSNFKISVERTSGANQTERHGNDKIVIKWNPRAGAFFPTTKTTQSPAMALGHEVAGHAERTVKDPGLKQNIHEERRVIDKVETPAAKTLGEGIRVKYEGVPIKVDDVLSRRRMENK
jgi:hypothetical protein